MYVLMNPMKPETADTSLPKEITWEYAQKEIAQVKGFATGSAGLSKGTLNLDLIQSTFSTRLIIENQTEKIN